MKKTSIFLLLGTLYLNINSQTLAYSWVKDFKGSGNETPNAITTDAAGNVYTVGRFDGSVDFDPGPGNTTLNSHGNQDIFVSKLDAAGNFIWARHVGSDLTDEANDVSVDSQGNVFVTGWYQDTIDFDPGPAVSQQISTGALDAFVLKLDASGNFVWAKKFGTPLPLGIGPGDFAEGKAISVDASGNIYTTGRFDGIIDFDPGVASFNQTAVGNEIYISKLDAQGNFVWLRKISGSNVEVVTDLALDSNTNPVICGFFYGTPDFDPGAGTFTMTNAASESAFVLKLDATGVFQWAVKLAGDLTTIPKYLTLSTSGDIYISGYYTGTTDFDPGAGTYTLTGGRMFAAKLSSAGNFAWAKHFATTNPGGMDLDISGNVFLSGLFSTTVDVDPGIPIYNLSPNADNIFIVKLDAGGNFVLAKNIGGNGNVSSSSIKLDPSGSAHVTGVFSGTADFDPGYDTATLTPLGTTSSDMYILKLAPCTEPIAPINNTTFGNQTICVGELIDLSATAGTATINWFPTPTATSILVGGNTYTVLASAAGTFTYYAEALSCAPSQVRTAITVTVNACTSIENYDNNKEAIRIFPVPFKDELTIKFQQPSENISVVVYSQTGDVVFHSSIKTTADINVDLQSKASGIYFVQIVENGLPTINQKIIKQ